VGLQQQWDRFNTDYTQELHNIQSDVRAGKLDNLPNGGFLPSEAR